MGSDYKVLLDVEEGLMAPVGVTVERETSTHNGRWKMWGALLAMALCVSAALLFTWNHKNEVHIEQADDLRHTLRQISGVKNAIHLEGYYDASYSNTTVQWSDDVSQAFSQGNLKLVNNEIVIPSTGLYFVYSQVSFKIHCQAEKMVHLSHSINKLSDSYGNSDDDDEKRYLPLLHSTRTVCGSSQGNSYTVVYMGAVFHMKDGDRLKTVTESRHVPHLQEKSGENFFGVFAL
ncbi:tumor necrosis factor a (TNF superfamily, member 2) [Hypomesus transpacificus]|uniref:tumor necrosis factor a (TNF superfamily, member 2) n=1 Tax=Hypomesus transpacificus TaxID=137520 RepID=UPI001F0777E9|nr:tumor necrosis factor a (TNF superfamily, member 2) [Hypomesus transpacificus]